MPFDAQLPQPPSVESAAQPLWTTLTRWVAPAGAAASDPDLGYESALPWTLGDHALIEAEPRRY